MARLRWWQYGILSGIALSMLLLSKIVDGLLNGELAVADIAGELIVVAMFFPVGFLCGLIVWAGQKLTRRFGMLGGAITGFL